VINPDTVAFEPQPTRGRVKHSAVLAAARRRLRGPILYYKCCAAGWTVGDVLGTAMNQGIAGGRSQERDANQNFSQAGREHL